MGAVAPRRRAPGEDACGAWLGRAIVGSRKSAFHAVVGFCWVFSVMACAKTTALPQDGLASVYAEEFNGKKTASGERYDSRRLTAAHRTLPLGKDVKVTNLANGKTVIVRINDRGPHVAGRIVDLSARAAASLGFSGGMARVRIDLPR